MSFFETNMQAVAERNSFLHQKLALIQDVESFEIFMDEGDVSSLNFVHTKNFTPMYETKAALHVAEQKKQFEVFDKHPFLYFFGMANGVFLKDLLTSMKHKRIVVIEPEIELLYVVLHMLDFSSEIESERIVFLDVQEVSFAVMYNLVKDYEVHRYAKVYELHINSNYYDKLYSEVIAYANKIFVDGFSHAISLAGNDPVDSLIGLKHYIKNIPNVIKTPPIRELITKLHQGESAILVSTGPSLNKQLPLLKEIAPHVVIVAVDASFPVLYHAGIKPDVVVSIERVKESARFFSELPEEAFDDVVIALSALQHDDVINSIKGGTVQMSLRPLSYMMHLGPEPWGYLGIGMSAANMAYELIFHSKFKNCILLGQDLAYAKDGASHAKGHVFGVENVKEKESDFFVRAWGNSGEIKTNRTWNIFRKSFEKDIAEANMHMQTINATEGGAHIDGTIEISFEDAVEKYIDKSKTKQVPKLLSAVAEAQKNLLHQTYDKVDEVKEYVQKLYGDVEILLSSLVKVAETICSHEEAIQVLTQVDALRSRVSEPIYEKVVWDIAQSMLLANDTEIARAEVYIAKDELQEKDRVGFLLSANKEWFLAFMGILDAILKTISYAEARRLINEVETIDVYVENEKIDSFTTKELQANEGRIFDVDMRGILYDVSDAYQTQLNAVVFRDAKSGDSLPRAFVDVIKRDDAKYNELSFMKSLEEPIDAKVAEMTFTPKSIGFLVTQDNLEDSDFMEYIQELRQHFKDITICGFCFNEVQAKQARSSVNNSAIEIHVVKEMLAMLQHISIYIFNSKYPKSMLELYWHVIYNFKNIAYIRYDAKVLDMDIATKDAKSKRSVFLQASQYFSLKVEDESLYKTIYNPILKELGEEPLDVHQSLYEFEYFQKVRLLLENQKVVWYLKDLDHKYKSYLGV